MSHAVYQIRVVKRVEANQIGIETKRWKKSQYAAVPLTSSENQFGLTGFRLIGSLKP